MGIIVAVTALVTDLITLLLLFIIISERQGGTRFASFSSKKSKHNCTFLSITQIWAKKSVSKLRFYHFRNHSCKSSCNKGTLHNQRRSCDSHSPYHHQQPLDIQSTVAARLLECHIRGIGCSNYKNSNQKIADSNTNSVHSFEVLLIMMQNYYPVVSTLDTAYFNLQFYHKKTANSQKAESATTFSAIDWAISKKSTTFAPYYKKEIQQQKKHTNNGKRTFYGRTI